MRWKKVVAGLGASAAIASGLVFGGGATAVADDCPSLYVVAIPGTWETGHEKQPQPGMLSGVTRGLPRNVDVDYVTYAATAFPWEGEVYGNSKKEAVSAARGLIGAMAQRCGGTRMALVGYSQGADAAGDLAAEIGTGLGVVPPDRLAGVGLISDPRRSPTDVQVGPPAPGAGASGPRPGGFGWVSDRVRTICAVDDLYCATAPDDFVTRFAGFLAQSSDANPANIWRYQLEAGAIINDLMAHGGMPTLQAQLSESANQKRAKDLERFYRSQAHTVYGSYSVGGGQTAISWMHNWIAGMA
ncbi:cutinase family protein [Nocardia farcinica]|uniref:Cutinase n=2 Tax=Nocardia TaxID=1817 RepID=A0A0H5PEI4_NOCFR|nr:MULTISPECIES: cutinase family protein [Nocardia]AXK87081.1 cutinase family protein [Nocardia farcinica]MBA4857962.1 cutinase family protein [Nocardia farcinica]MBC9815592.1 cutinase family protein [Nocardia farcinica]MBF6069990.1 cutinase family protein [Nocardia farcinica]MBF6142856.1 cutinase family protein [Nocardia farcinica]